MQFSVLQSTLCLFMFILLHTHIKALEDEIWNLGTSQSERRTKRFRLWLTVSAQHRFLEVSWKNAPANAEDHILITAQEPHNFEKIEVRTGTPLTRFDEAVEGSGAYIPSSGFTSTTAAPNVEDGNDKEGSGYSDGISDWKSLLPSSTTERTPKHYWISNNGLNDIVAAIKPTVGSQWFTTGVPFDYNLSRNVTINTNCYGYWASYIDGTGKVLESTCVRAYPRWMHDMHSVVGGMRMRDLFIPGTHDSGSYRPNFHPLKRETIVTKYALTQDDDIRGQLMHGVRYLDIRVGYYRNSPDIFYINHGITQQRPLSEVIDQVKDFVFETNEIVIFGLKEFPVGFGKNLAVHRLLVHFLQERFDDLIVDPSLTWSASLNEIWSRRQNIILAYDKGAVVQEYPHLLFKSVEQRWGNVKSWTQLERHLKMINNFDVSRLFSRPVADMAELTPDTWGVLLDKYGGLRKMADNVNWRVSQLYQDELGENANIVAADFIRGTTLMETAIDWNRNKVIF